MLTTATFHSDILHPNTKRSSVYFTGGTRGIIVFDSTKFSILPKSYFIPQLNDLLSTVTRDKGAAPRVIIAHYLCHAVLIARQLFDMRRLAYHHEYPVGAENVPGIGFLSENLDFMSARIKGEGPLGILSMHVSRLIEDDEMLIPHGGEDYIVEEPILAVFEAKHASTLDSPNSKAELLGQLRVLPQK